jgi:LysM repeat protein
MNISPKETRRVIQGKRSTYGQPVLIIEDYDSERNINNSLFIEEVEVLENKQTEISTNVPFSTEVYQKNDQFDNYDIWKVNNQQNDKNFLIHKVTGRENLQGLSVKYGVQVADLKRINKLWNQNDIFGRKELIIPISSEDFIKYQALHPNRVVQELTSEKIEEMILKFVQMTSCDPSLAKFFLEQKNYNFTKALGMFHRQASEKLQSKSLKSYLSKDLLFNEEKNEKLNLKSQNSSNSDLLGWEEALLIPSETTIRVSDNIERASNLKRVNRKIQEQFAQDDEEIFLL